MRPIVLLLGLLLSSCAALPRQGFATRYFGGTLGPTMRAVVVPVTDFAGNSIGEPYHSEFQAAPPAPRPPMVHGISTTDCKEMATERAHDVGEEGFDAEVQQSVFDSALADCRRWQARGAR